VKTLERQKAALLEYRNAAVLKWHPNIVTYEWYLQSGPFIYFQMEYFQFGSLEKFLQENVLYDEMARREKEIVWNFLLDILMGLIWIHKNGYVHLDIKPANIFLVEPRQNSTVPTLKIGDFGLSRKIGSTQRSKFEKFKKGDGHYLAPELLDKSKIITENVDIYSLGITLYEMAADYKASAALWEEVRLGVIATEKVSEDLAHILRRMLCTNADLRPAATALFVTSDKLLHKASELGITIPAYDDIGGGGETDDKKLDEEMSDAYKGSSDVSDDSDADVDAEVEDVEVDDAEDLDSEDSPNENSNPNKQTFDSVKKKLF